MYLARLIAQRDLPLNDLLDRYELFVYKQWLRVYMRSTLIKHNKDLFQCLDDTGALLEAPLLGASQTQTSWVRRRRTTSGADWRAAVAYGTGVHASVGSEHEARGIEIDDGGQTTDRPRRTADPPMRRRCVCRMR